MKKQLDETITELAERIFANLADHQGCAMSLDLTQGLMRDAQKIIKLCKGDK